MLRRLTAIALILALLTLGAASSALAENAYGAQTPLAGASEAKLNNVALAVAALDGTFLAYGESFSFNEAVGPRTKDNGYRRAANGRGAEVVGGGVAQVATTLYLALLQVPGRLQFGPISTYGDRFADDYVDDGDLAIVTDADSGKDLSFTNYADNMTLSLWLEGDALHCAVELGPREALADWFADWDAPAQPTAAPLTGSRRVSAVSLECGDEAGVLHNVNLAADCVYDTTLASGDTFSFNEIVGPRTAKYGFKSATNGRGVQVVGGGVAQVASAVWLAVKDMDDITIVEKSTYGKKYNQSYVARSSDAILTDYNSERDFAFTYTGEGAITLYTWLEDETLNCEIYRTP